MKLRSPTAALVWEIWANNLAGLVVIGVILLAGPVLLAALNAADGWRALVNPVGYALTAAALLVVPGCFHFTEGARKAGFGSFPMRLFNLPVRTRFLVALPMVCGASVITLVYLLCAWLLLSRTGPELPLLWPCLYLVFGLTQFQMIIWSLPESRYLKLLCLSTAASVITFGWMFFIPNIVEGALSDWGYAGDPAVFMRRLLVVLATTGPAAYLVSLLRVWQQRHGRTRRSQLLTAGWELTVGRLLHRSTPFGSGDHAIFWQEWRRTGLVLPIVTVVIIALTCLPAWLSGGLSARATMGILTWLFIAPPLFALVIGRGFGKPDFWSADLKIGPFQAILPVTAGQWIAAKLKVALVSAMVTWALMIYLAFIWTAFAGDLEGLDVWLSQIRFYYTPAERWLMLFLFFPASAIVTWSFLVAGLATGSSGRKFLYRTANFLVGFGLFILFVLTIWRSDHEDHSVKLYDAWRVIAWLPMILTFAVMTKMFIASFVWVSVLKAKMASPRSAARYFVVWLFAVGCLSALFFIFCRNTLWLRHLLMLIAILLVPLARPALAMQALASNRSDP